MDTGEVLYGSRADLYDLIYDFKNYRAEAQALRELLGEFGVADGARILEAACGTGRYLQALQQWYRMSGFDLSEDMLAIARTRVPGAELLQADMCDFTVAEPFDAAMCLFSSIGYATPEDRLRDAARCLASAVRPGGVLVIQPWLSPDDYLAGTPHLQTYDSAEIKLCRANVAKRDGALSILDFHWLVVRAGEDVDHFTERHVLQLYTEEQMLSALTAAGLDAEFRPGGRGHYVAVRPG